MRCLLVVAIFSINASRYAGDIVTGLWGTDGIRMADYYLAHRLNSQHETGDIQAL